MISTNLMIILVVFYGVILAVAVYERNWPVVLYWFGAMCILSAVLWMKERV